MNTITGTMSGGIGGADASVATDVGSLAVHDAGAATLGTAVVLGIRAEHLHLVDPEAEPAALRARVENVELLGHERHLVCAVGDAIMTVRQPNDAVTVKVGQDIALHADSIGVHLFDAATTERLN